MTVSTIGALAGPSNTPLSTNSTAATSQAHHKHGVHSLTGSFAVTGAGALGAIGSATVNASKNVLSALSNLKSVI